MLLISLIACIIISTGSFAWGYHLAGHTAAAQWLTGFGILWLAAQWFKWRWFPALSVLLALACAAFGILFNLAAAWMFIGATFALFAWDLNEFQMRMKLLSPREDISGRTRRRLIRMAFLSAAGILLALLFGWLRG